MRPKTTGRNASRRALDAMRNMRDQGWDTEALLVDHAAEVLGGGDVARSIAQAAYDRHFKITTPN